ncbi:hypothetical protein GEMRC1_005634 [Eukaryota sp. GEM-RC1]
MDSTLNNPNLRLSQYFLAFRQTLSRCRLFLPSNFKVLEHFARGIQPRSIQNIIFDEIHCSSLDSISEVIARTSELFDTLKLYSNNKNLVYPQNNSTNNNPAGNFEPQNRSHHPNSSATSNKNGRFCSFCKKPGHTIEYCRDPKCRRSQHFKNSANPSQISSPNVSAQNIQPPKPLETNNQDLQSPQPYFLKESCYS